MGKDEIAAIESQGTFELDLDGERVSLVLEDVEISSQDIPGWSVASEGKTTVALDITLTDELQMEGLARDLVNRVQNMRKDMGLEVQDKIDIRINRGDDFVEKSVEANREYICTETQALSLELTDSLNAPQEVEIDERTLAVEIQAR